MTAFGEREPSPSSAGGRVFRLGADWAVCSFRLPTSMPIPLAVLSPAEIDLSTWAFAGMKAPTHRPTCLLLVQVRHAAASAALANGTRLVVRTHFHDLAISMRPQEAFDGLPSDERSLMARAVLSSVTADNVAALAEPIGLLAPALRGVPAAKDGPDLNFAAGRADACSLTGTEVPNFILFDTESGLRCARVATARVTLSPKASMDLTLEPVWGPETGPVRGTILIRDGHFTVARIATAQA